MALFKMGFYSESLGMQSSVLVVIPQRNSLGEIGVKNNADEKPPRVLYLLHGLSDDHTIWMRRTSIERYATKYGIAVVMPNAHRSFYTDMKYGLKYYTYLTRELPMRIKEFFKLSDKREDTFIAGLSMGGYGALKAAMRDPDIYAAAAGLSAVTDIASFRNGWFAALEPIFGSDPEIPEEEDLIKLAEKHKNDAIKPRLYIGIGKQDILYDQNRKTRAIFEENGYDVTYRESDGNHNWEFWDEYIRYVLEWMFGK